MAEDGDHDGGSGGDSATETAGGSSGEGGEAGGSGIDPGGPSAYVEVRDGQAGFGFASFRLTCGHPVDFETVFMPECRGQTDYFFTFDMPAEQLVPGTVDLSALPVDGFEISQGPNFDGSCWEGSGGGGVGWMEILSVGDDEVVVRLNGAFSERGVPDPLDFVVVRCGEP